MHSSCDFDHLAKTVAKLTSFSSFTPWGAMLSRILGTVFGRIQGLITAISEGSRAGQYYDVGKAIGEIVVVILDTTF